MQRKNCFLIAVLLFLLIGCFASFKPLKASSGISPLAYAAPPVEWVGGITAVGSCDVKQTTNGGYIQAGSDRPNSAWLAKTDSFGRLEWNKTFSQPRNSVMYYGRAVQQTKDGGFMLLGYAMAMNMSDLHTSPWLVKTDEYGNTKWETTFGGLQGSVSSGQQTDDGGYVLAGSCLIKTDNDGNVQWVKTYGVGASSVQQTSDGGYILAGSVTPSRSIYTNCWLAKTDLNGNLEWNRTYGENWASAAYCVRQTTDGGYVFAGFANNQEIVEGNGGNALVVKTNSTGEIEWTDSYYGTPSISGWAQAYSVEQTSDGGLIVAGDTSVNGQSGTRMFLLKTHSGGSGFDWSGIYGGNNVTWARSVVQTSDGGYVVAGSGLTKILADRPLVAYFKYSPTYPIVNESIAFNANYSYDRNENIVSYLWNFDDGNITSITNPTVVHRYENSGVYNVSLRVVDAVGLNSTYSQVLCAMTPTSISISTSTPPATAGYAVSISGTLLDLYGNRVRNETVKLYYAYTGYGNWSAIASEQTNSSGDFSAEWVPPTPSYYVIKAVYAGNYTDVESSKNITLSMLPYGEAYMFTVESNSTISSMGFNTNTQTLSLTATGVKGTKGYTKVTAAKSLVPNLSSLSVLVDGAEYQYNVTEANNSWVLLFIYNHSSHQIEIRLNSIIPEFPSVPIMLLLMTATLIAVTIYRKKRLQN